MLNMLYGLCYIRPMPRYNIQYMLYDHTLFLCAYVRVCACVANILLAFHLHLRQFAYFPLIFLRVSRIIMLIYLLCLIYVNMLLALLLLLLLEM